MLACSRLAPANETQRAWIHNAVGGGIASSKDAVRHRHGDSIELAPRGGLYFLEGNHHDTFFSTFAKLWGTFALFCWLPMSLFALDEWFKAMARVRLLPRGGGSRFHVVEAAALCAAVIRELFVSSNLLSTFSVSTTLCFL
jgi:hypothetical protein